MKQKKSVASLVVFLFAILTISCESATLKIPQDHPTLQSAVDSASPGDTIILSPGNHCGAFVNKRLEIRGEGNATIVGCDSPKHPAGFKVGLWLSSQEASGSHIHHLSFDGSGVSNTNLDPLGAAIFARDLNSGNNKINNIETHHVRILGAVQGITNNGGDGWNVHHNEIENLSVFDCATGAKLCGGGVGIVLQIWRGSLPSGQTRSRPTNNTIAHNKITGQVPNTLTAFSMTSVFLLNTDNSTIENNKTSIPDNPNTEAGGIGIWLTHVCCGIPSFAPGSQSNTIATNDGRDSEYALIVDTNNTDDLALRGNLGLNLIGDEATQIKNRSIKTFQEFP